MDTAGHPLRVDALEHVTRAQLEERYLSSPGSPVVLKGAIRSWPALTKWTFRFVGDRFGAEDIVAMDRLLTPTAAFRMKVGTFVEYCGNPERFAKRVDTTQPLYTALQPFSLDSDLLDDFVWPEAIANMYSELGPEIHDWYLHEFGVLLIGPAGTLTPLHEDLFGTHAWLAQIMGRKRFRFFPPDRDGGVRRRSARAARRQVDHSLDKTADAPRYEVVVNQGDMIIFPQGWRHEVVSLDPSISLSFNFVNNTNYVAHLLEIFRDLPAWSKRLNTPRMRAALPLEWDSKDFEGQVASSTSSV